METIRDVNRAGEERVYVTYVTWIISLSAHMMKDEHTTDPGEPWNPDGSKRLNVILEVLV